jgi:hypothetical protein
MNAHDMKVGNKYVVTKASDDETLNVGDHVHIYSDGAIGCVDAGGWVSAKDGAAAAMIGCEVEVDRAWLDREFNRLLAVKRLVEANK